MGRTHTIEFHPLQLRHWLHEHQWFVRTGLGLAIAVLIVAIAIPTAAMIREAVADQGGAFDNDAEAITNTTLPREWIWSVEPVSFDHMYRDSDSDPVIDSMITRRRSSR
jgi:hypothetical protein